ncbi:MAG: 30S ribosomal protein S21 [Parvularculaceae bacterium]|nr:30S ribosomal protein S21 [Parvularculaceae bacterium]
MDSRRAFWYRAARRGPAGRPGRWHSRQSRRRRKDGTAAFLFQKEGIPLVQIVVRDNNVEQALRALKKKMQREGTFREMKRRKFYEKPSEKKARQKAEAVRRARKLIRKRLQREGAL